MNIIQGILNAPQHDIGNVQAPVSALNVGFFDSWFDGSMVPFLSSRESPDAPSAPNVLPSCNRRIGANL